MPPGTLVASVSLNQGSPAQARLAIIDTAPHSADAAIIAAEAADLVLVPCRPGILDLHAIGSTAWIVKLAGKPAFVILNAPRPALLQKPGGGQCFGSSPLVAEAKFLPDPGEVVAAYRIVPPLLCGMVLQHLQPADHLLPTFPCLRRLARRLVA